MRRREFLTALAAIATAPSAFAQGVGGASTTPEQFGRQAQRLNQQIAAQIVALPSAEALAGDAAGTAARLVGWTTRSREALAAVTVALGDLRQPEGASPAHREAMDRQSDALRRFTEAFALLAGQIQNFAGAEPARLTAQVAWYADAYYDSRLLAQRIQHDMILAQSNLTPDLFLSPLLLTLGHTADIKIDLFRAMHAGVHEAPLDADSAASRFRAAVARAEPALAAARAAFVSAEAPMVWAPDLDHEQAILVATIDFAEALEAMRRRMNERARNALTALIDALNARSARVQRTEQTFAL